VTPLGDNWASGPGGDDPLEGQLSFSDHDPQLDSRARKAERVKTDIGAGLRQSGAAGVTVQVTDLSIDGFSCTTHMELGKGTDVWLRLPGLEATHATVIWSRASKIGCVFEHPLHSAVVDMVVRKSRPA